MKHISLIIACATALAAATFAICHMQRSMPVVITSYQQALIELGTADEHTLVLFDIDDTLINPVDVMGRHYMVPTLFKLKALWRYPSLWFQRNIEHYYSIMWLQSGWFVIEPEVVDIINTLKQRGCTVLAVSSMETGAFGVIDSFPEWRFELLQKLGISFDQRFGNMTFGDLPAYRGNHPELYNGILCCNQQPKDLVVQAFLGHYKLHPTKIIFFDDHRKSVKAMGRLCAQRGIAYAGFEYHGEQWQPGVWDEQRAYQQLDHLFAHDQWLPDAAL